METFDIISPIDGSIFANRHYASVEDIEETLDTSVLAQDGWKHTSLSERKVKCRKAVDHLVAHAEEIGEEITQMMGRPIRYTANEIKGGLKERAEYMISIAEETLEQVEVGHQEGFEKFIRKEPLGSILILCPWNYPYLTSINAIIPALLSGNSVILKHADQTALCAERYAEAFAAAGLPPGVFQFLHLNHGQVSSVIQDTRISHVCFTGSIDGGRAIQSAANQRFIHAGLELGGKDPAYVRSDADLDHAVENLVDGAFFNSGQSCCGIERIYVHETVYDDFINAFVKLTRSYVLGDPTDTEVTLGPVVRALNAEKIRNQVDQAIKSGAKPLIEAESFPQPGPCYLAPQVLVDVNHKMKVMNEETFGPVVGIMKVKNDNEAITLMNDSKYGLTASVWTNDLDKAVQIANQIEVGTVFANRCDYLDPQLAWTGVKDSGKGHTLSKLGFEQFVRPKSFHIKKIS